ncbi:bifunctional phosphoribosylaminoimidazole carboxylase/phosphoribosylaminoimidazole succinocarboxamide synthetase isoform X2 [Ambystoma mexicanum]|uniref:bifunctional phosphoribosylaminoimidazole carboxylase/phosphoribosylaminoimidazole succinocarboxamide synthetase isoform X2 n=1 Tax=Ambystoma mexicanum TaxID=8296 RepID=UPI0037E8312E
MERGTGRYWTEEEIKALLSVWSEKHIRKQLRETLRNKGIFVYIAKRLQELGVCRDWKQCRAKYKNLKYEYRTVKGAHSSGEGAKTMRFFHELDGILRDETGTESAEEEVGLCTPSEAHLDLGTSTGRAAGEISTGIEDDDDDTMEDALPFVSSVESTDLGHLRPFIESSNCLGLLPPIASEGGKHWTVEEVRALVHVWSDKNIQRQLEGTVRNKGIFEQIAVLLQEFGVDRDWKQCRTKYKNLKHEFKMAKKGQLSGNPSKIMRFFEELETILGPKTPGHSDAEDGEDSAAFENNRLHHVREIPEDVDQGDSFSNIYDDPRAPEIKKERIDKGQWILAGSNEDNSINYLSDDPLITYIKEEENDDLGCPLLPPDPSSQRLRPEAAHRAPSSITIEGGKHWSVEEIRALINVWSDPNIQRQLRGTLRNKGIFEHIAAVIQKFGIDRDWKQCRTKYKNLKHEYKLVKQCKDSGNPSKMMHFFNELDAILGPQDESFMHSDTEERTTLWSFSIGKNDSSELCNDMDEEESVYSVSETAAISSVKKESSEIDADSISTTSDDPAIQLRRGTSITTSEFSKPNRGTQDHQVSNPPAFAESGRHWTVDEVRTLIQAWSDKNIQRQLEGTVRNKIIFEHIASLLQKHGIDRDWKQCRTKYKNLKYEYKMTKKAHMSGDTNRTMRFFSELDAILGPKTSRQSPQSDKGENSVTCTNSRKQHCASDDDGASTTSEDTPTAKRIPKNEHSTSRNCGEETGMSLVDEIYKSTGKRKGPEREIPVPIKKRTAENIANSSEQNREDVIHRILKKTFCKQQRDSYGYNRMRSDILHPHVQACRFPEKMEASAELKLGKKLNEGKTKQVYELPDLPGYVLMQSKDQITAGNMAKKDQIEGKAFISNKTTSCIFKLLQEAGIKSAFVRKYSDTAFIAAHCEMIPIEWVCRRIATGSFLKRNPGVKEGYKFYPPKIETFFKDDANNDPEWSEAQLIEAKFVCAGLEIGQAEVDIMNRSTLAVFEILEKAWSTQECTLVDMKIEFGVDVSKQEIVLADVIDNDSWRLWPSGDRSQQKDKQVYRDLKEVTPEALQMVKRNFEWVADKVELLLASKSLGRVVVLMGSISDLLHCEKIKKSCANYGIPCELRVTSAHKGPDETLRIKAEYEGDGIPTVFVAVAGRSNGLGPVMSGNTAYPVINCPPLTPDWGSQDVWSSLRMPSGLGCSTVLSPEAAAQFAAQIFGLTNHLIWSKLRSSTLNTWISLKQADKKLRECSM